MAELPCSYTPGGKATCGSRISWCVIYPGGSHPMDPFQIAKNSWGVGDTREVEQERLRKEIGVEYDSYRRIYIVDGHEWTIAGQIARENGKKYYILAVSLYT